MIMRFNKKKWNSAFVFAGIGLACQWLLGSLISCPFFGISLFNFYKSVSFDTKKQPLGD